MDEKGAQNEEEGAKELFGDYGREEAGEEGEYDDDPPPPPPPEQEKELLFLIEFLVDTLKIKHENMNVENIDPCALTGPAIVCLTFLHFPPMMVGEKDVDPDKLTGRNVIQFNSGKSLMFALTESQFESPPDIYLLVTATKEMPHAFRFSQLLIGKTKIQLSELFKQLFEKYDENPGKTVSKSIKDSYELMGEKNKAAGELTLYIRLTCIGENIVTEFKKPEDMYSTLFKNEESMRIYECREVDRSGAGEGKVLPGWGASNGRPCAEEYLATAPPDPEDENFEEIYAEINGSAIVVKVEKSNRKDPPKKYHVSEFCDCNIPLPYDLVAGMSDLSVAPVSEGNAEPLPNVPAFAGSSGPGFGKEVRKVGIDPNNRLYFQVPPPEILSQTNKTLAYNVKTCQNKQHAHRDGSYRVLTDNNPEGPPPSLPNDPEKDVFMLRIIKRGRKTDGKDAVKLEFKTPKEKIVPPPKPPYMIDMGVGPEKKRDKKKH